MCIRDSNKGLLWVGVKNFGLNMIDMKSGTVYKYHNNSGPDYTGLVICADFLQLSDNEYWIGSIPLKRVLFDRMNHSFKLINEFRHDINDPNSNVGWVVTDIYKDRRGEIWVSTFDGLNPVSYTHLDVYKRQILLNMPGAVASILFGVKVAAILQPFRL